MNVSEAAGPARRAAANWRQVGLFLLLTFGATAALNLALYWTGGYGSANTLLFLQLQMLLPAFFAILLGVFFFADSRIYIRTLRDKPRWFYFFYLGFTLFYVLMAVGMVVQPEQGPLFSQLSGQAAILGLMFLIFLRAISGSEAFARAGLQGGRRRDWLLYGLAFVVFYALQAALNAAFGLGERVDLKALLEQMGVSQSGLAPGVLLLALGVQTILVGSLIGLLLGFGEEYGWRGYLQNELVRLGKKRGVLLVGLIWSVWHYPVIWMGHNYPGYPVEGTVLMTIYTALLAFILGYVMLKTGSVWLVAFLHTINNQTYSFFSALVYRPESPIWSFASGVYGLPIMALIVLVLLRDPIWRDDIPAAQPTLSPAQAERLHPAEEY